MQSVMPPAMVQSIEIMTPREKLVFFLSGLNCELVTEWRHVYIAIVDYVYTIYKEFLKQIN